MTPAISPGAGRGDDPARCDAMTLEDAMLDPSDLPAFTLAVIFSLAIVALAIWDYRRKA